jgi:DNA-binding HxlR family transcriptional regulator
MNHSSTGTRPEPDAVERALAVLADRWTFLVLREAFFGVHRYGFFQRNLGIGRNVLAARLSDLVEHGVLKRVRYRTDPDWYEYRLTKAGYDLFPVILALKAWSEQYLLDPDEVKLDIHHCACGNELNPVVICECCGKPLSAEDVDYEWRAEPVRKRRVREPALGSAERRGVASRPLRTADSPAR